MVDIFVLVLYGCSGILGKVIQRKSYLWGICSLIQKFPKDLEHFSATDLEVFLKGQILWHFSVEQKICTFLFY